MRIFHWFARYFVVYVVYFFHNVPLNDNLEAQAQLLYQEYINLHTLKDVSLLDIATIRYGKGLSTQELLPSGYPVFGGNGIIGYFSNYLYELPQIIISCRGVASGKVLESHPYSFITSNSLVVELKDRTLYEWVKRSLLNTSLDECVTGSAQPQITIDNLKNVTLPMPCDDSCLKLVSLLASISTHCYNLQMECERLKQAQITAITKLLNG